MRRTGERGRAVISACVPPHPNPPPQGGRGQDISSPNGRPSCSLPPCGGGRPRSGGRGSRWGVTSAIVTALLLSSASRADEIPVVGRPAEHFYGAAGERVTATAELSAKEVRLDESITLTLRLAGVLNAKDIKRPDLGQLPDFHNRFHVTDLPDPAKLPPGERVFVYGLRPRSENVTAAPDLEFRYYRPSTRSFAVAYAVGPPLRVLPPTEKEPPAPVSLDVPDFARTLAPINQSSFDESIPRWLVIPGLVAPPFAYLLWWRYGPDSARDERRERSRAARQAIAALRHRSPPHAVMIAYLGRRFTLPPTARTPAEVRTSLDSAGQPLADRVGAFLGHCDAVRFGGRNDDLASEAERLILDLEDAA